MFSKPIQLAIVDDHTLFRKALKNYLSDQPDLNVLFQAVDMYDLYKKLKGNTIEILILDVFLPGMNANDALKAIRIEYPDLKILVLSMSTDMNLIGEMLDAGIHGYISKADEPEELLSAIRAAAEDRIYRNGLFTEALYRNKQKDIRMFGADAIALLSDREKRILQLIWDEKSNKEIADELFLGIRSVEKIRQDMKEKIGVRSTVGLLKFAIENKIIGQDIRMPGVVR
jgi:DNA-binding NarL/FixJ family response regulator